MEYEATYVAASKLVKLFSKVSKEVKKVVKKGKKTIVIVHDVVE